jgi:hypothetical protein
MTRAMSKHHHNPHEGHSSGNAPGTGRKPLHHDWRFYAAGLCILVALLVYLLSGDLAFQPRVGTPAPPPLSGAH